MSDSRLDDVLRLVRGRTRLWAALRGGALLALALAAAAGLSFALDFGLRLDRITRAVLGLLMLAGLVTVVRRALTRPLLAPLSDDDVALAMERRFPRLGEAVVSAVQFRRRHGEPGVSTELMRDVEQRAESAVVGLPLERLFRSRPIGRLALAGGAVLLGLVVLASFFPAHAGLWLRRNVLLSGQEWPRRTRLVVEGMEEGVLRVPRGETVALVVRAEGVLPRGVNVEYEFDGGLEGEAVLADITGGRFRHVFRDVVESVTFRFLGGDGETGPLRIEVLDRPAAEWMRLHLAFPAYLERDAAVHDVVAGGVGVPEGTEIEVRARTRAAVGSATLRYGDQDLAVEVRDGREVSARFRPEAGAMLALSLTDRNGLDSDPAVTANVRVVPDAPPRATLHAVDVGSSVTPQALLSLEAALEDDHGLSDGALLRTTIGLDEKGPVEPTVEPLPGIEVSGREAAGGFSLDLQGLALEPGAAVRLVARATDNDGLQGPKEGRSEPLTFRVVSRDDLMAEMLRRQQEIRRDLERVLERVREDRKDLDATGPELSKTPIPPEAGRGLLELARDQGRSGRRVAELSDRFGRILAEMRTNRLLSDAERGTLASAIVRPMDRLAREVMPQSAKHVLAAAKGETPEGRLHDHARAVGAYDDVIRRLLRILEALSRAEGFTELVERLRQVVRLEGEVRAATESEYRRRIEELFPEEKDEEGEKR